MANPDPSILPAAVIAFLAAPSEPIQGSEVRAQVTRYPSADPTATDTLSCGLRLNSWDITVCADGSHAELWQRNAHTTITLLGDWQAALGDLRVLLADPRLDLLLALAPEPEA